MGQKEVSFQNEFDLVLNMGDGAIGYLENDIEKMKIASDLFGFLSFLVGAILATCMVKLIRKQRK